MGIKRERDSQRSRQKGEREKKHKIERYGEKQQLNTPSHAEALNFEQKLSDKQQRHEEIEEFKEEEFSEEVGKPIGIGDKKQGEEVKNSEEVKQEKKGKCGSVARKQNKTEGVVFPPRFKT